MNDLVKVLTNDDGDAQEDNGWCLVDPCNSQGPARLCTQEFFGLGESNCAFKTRSVNKGGVTCPECLQILRTYKAVRL